MIFRNAISESLDVFRCWIRLGWGSGSRMARSPSPRLRCAEQSVPDHGPSHRPDGRCVCAATTWQWAKYSNGHLVSVLYISLLLHGRLAASCCWSATIGRVCLGCSVVAGACTPPDSSYQLTNLCVLEIRSSSTAVAGRAPVSVNCHSEIGRVGGSNFAR